MSEPRRSSEDLGHLGTEQNNYGQLILIIGLFTFYNYGPSNSILAWVLIMAVTMVANLYVNQENMLYAPTPMGLSRKLAGNPPGYRSPSEVAFAPPASCLHFCFITDCFIHPISVH